MATPDQPATLVINGQDVPGTDLPDGSFYSDDGTAIVLSDGTALTGTLDYNNGLFTADDGATYLITDDGIEPTGVAIINGQDVPGTYLPDGSFYSDDGTAIILSDGTVLAGTLDDSTGIFTATTGATYFLSDNGILPATPQSDGSYKLPDGDVVMTPQAWKVDLAAFADAITTVSGLYDDIQGLVFNNIQAVFNTIESQWQSPAGTSFVAARTNFNIVALDLLNVLYEVKTRMGLTLVNYQITEITNTENLQ